MKITAFNIENFKIDGGAMYGVVPRIMWNKVYPSDENNQIILSLRTLVVENEGHIAVIDNGIGNKQSEKFLSRSGIFGGEGLITGLANRGYKPDDITDVVITHLHYDHCGGGVKKNFDGSFGLTFPNAKYHVSKSHWEWATNPNPREADAFLPENILPMRDLGALNLIEKEGELFPGFSVKFFDGHTRGQMIPFISYRGKTIVFAADLFPSTAHLPLPWIMAYDVEPLKTLKEKEIFLSEALKNDYILFYQHDYYTECSRVMQGVKGVKATDGFTFESLLKELDEQL